MCLIYQLEEKNMSMPTANFKTTQIIRTNRQNSFRTCSANQLINNLTQFMCNDIIHPQRYSSFLNCIIFA